MSVQEFNGYVKKNYLTMALENHISSTLVEMLRSTQKRLDDVVISHECRKVSVEKGSFKNLCELLKSLMGKYVKSTRESLAFQDMDSQFINDVDLAFRNWEEVSKGIEEFIFSEEKSSVRELKRKIASYIDISIKCVTSIIAAHSSAYRVRILKNVKDVFPRVDTVVEFITHLSSNSVKEAIVFECYCERTLKVIEKLKALLEDSHKFMSASVEATSKHYAVIHKLEVELNHLVKAILFYFDSFPSRVEGGFSRVILRHLRQVKEVLRDLSACVSEERVHREVPSFYNRMIISETDLSKIKSSLKQDHEFLDEIIPSYFNNSLKNLPLTGDFFKKRILHKINTLKESYNLKSGSVSRGLEVNDILSLIVNRSVLQEASLSQAYTSPNWINSVNKVVESAENYLNLLKASVYLLYIRVWDSVMTNIKLLGESLSCAVGPGKLEEIRSRIGALFLAIELGADVYFFGEVYFGLIEHLGTLSSLVDTYEEAQKATSCADSESEYIEELMDSWSKTVNVIRNEVEKPPEEITRTIIIYAIDGILKCILTNNIKCTGTCMDGMRADSIRDVLIRILPAQRDHPEESIIRQIKTSLETNASASEHNFAHLQKTVSFALDSALCSVPREKIKDMSKNPFRDARVCMRLDSQWNVQ